MADAVGGVLGATVGFLVGGPAGAQWGWAIGSTIGASFNTVKQPRLGDLAAATAGEGGPRGRVYGLFRPISGQVVWAGKAREIRTRKRQGKGGPKVESSTILRSYAIGICEGPINGVLRIWRNNELVYDVRGNSAIPAESVKWLQGKTILLGGYDQMPHPTIQAEAGAANAPAMRGTALLVVTDEDLTDLRGAIPSYQFEVGRALGRRLTTLMYPLDPFVEEIAADSRPIDGEVRTLLKEANVTEAMNLNATVFSGTLSGDPPGVESLDILATPHSGRLFIPPSITEAINTNGTPESGVLKIGLITDNIDPEALDINGTAQAGTLS